MELFFLHLSRTTSKSLTNILQSPHYQVTITSVFTSLLVVPTPCSIVVICFFALHQRY